MTLIAEHLLRVKNRIHENERRFHRIPNSVQLIAISKSQNLQTINEAIAAGQLAFGESYVKESLEKILKLKNYHLEWHFVGKIQRNKAKLIAENFSWVHSLSEIKTAEYLNYARKAANLPPMNACIQINLDKESNKTGIYLENLLSFTQSLQKLPNLKLRGLMIIPKIKTNFIAQREDFKKLRLALEQLQKMGFQLDTLSMGMTDDFEAAIAEGATHIRIGTAIFGKRKFIS